MKMEKYVRPLVSVMKVESESELLNYSAETTNPKEGGDPTGGGSSSSNPFGGNSAKEFSVWEDDRYEER